MDEVPDTRPSLLVRLSDCSMTTAPGPNSRRSTPPDLPIRVPEGVSRTRMPLILSRRSSRRRFRRGSLGTRSTQRAFSQLAVPNRAEQDAVNLHHELCRRHLRRAPGSEEIQSRCSKPGPPRLPRRPRSTRPKYKRSTLPMGCRTAGQWRPSGTTWSRVLRETGVEGKKALNVVAASRMSIGRSVHGQEPGSVSADQSGDRTGRGRLARTWNRNKEPGAHGGGSCL